MASSHVMAENSSFAGKERTNIQLRARSLAHLPCCEFSAVICMTYPARFTWPLAIRRASVASEAAARWKHAIIQGRHYPSALANRAMTDSCVHPLISGSFWESGNNWRASKFPTEPLCDCRDCVQSPASAVRFNECKPNIFFIALCAKDEL